MSTIERAIIGEDYEEESKPKQDAPASDFADDDAPTPARASGEPAREPTPSPAPAKPEPAAARPEPAPSGHEQPTQRTGQYFDVDIERLEAQGFIFPETGPQRLAEEYRHIKRRILGNTVPGILKSHRPANLVMITSSVPGEGKTFTSVNISLSIAAELDKTVLVVDSDIIKSDLTRAFGMSNQLGLFDYLEKPEMGVENVIYRTSIPTLSIIPAGRSDSAISEKLASGAMKRLTDELASRYSDRVIIFDCPPILATSGATALAPHVSQVIMVVEARDTAQSTVRDALKVIGEDKVTGVILNKSKHSSSRNDYYYYGYGYQKGEARQGA